MAETHTEGAANAPDLIETRGWQRRARLPLMLLGVIVVVGIALYVYLSGGRVQSTDDAYVKTAMVSISANVAGRVVALAVHDNQSVHAGDLLYKLDDAPYQVVVEEAQAQLADARLRVGVLKANYRERLTQQASARETLAFQQRELERQQRLIGAGISSQAQVDRAMHTQDEAREQVSGSQQSIGAVLAQLGGDPNIDPEQYPAVKQARAALERAQLNLSYTTVRAPSDGIVTRVEELQVGSYVNASVPVFALVSAHDVWVEANFKEDQLTHMRVGQEANVEVDSYPGKTFKGKVSSLSPGTGSQFSVLPPENATGNWVKVVQRLPVRIELEQVDPSMPLHGGLSANVDIDTGYKRHLFGPGDVQSASPVASN